MSRGRKRNQRRRKTVKAGNKLTRTPGESAASKSYTEGNTWGYTSRIAGPVSPVIAKSITDE